MRAVRTTLIVLTSLLSLVTGLSAQNDSVTTAPADPPIIYIDPPLDDGVAPGVSADQPLAQPERVLWNLYELRWNAPYLGTDRWTRGEYGLGIEFTVPSPTDRLKNIRPLVDYRWTNLGFDGLTGTGNFLKTGATIAVNERWELTAFVDGLLASVTGQSYWDAVVGTSWYQYPTKLPWKGWYAQGEAMTGTGLGDRWLVSRVMTQWNWHLIPETLMVVTSGSVVASWLPGSPVQRLPVVESGFGSLPRELVAGPLVADRSYQSATVVSLRARASVPLSKSRSNRTFSLTPRLNITGGPWLGRVTLPSNGQASTIGWDSGLVAGIGVAVDTTVRTSRGEARRIDPVVTVEVETPFSTISNRRTWRLSLLTFFDPSQLLRM